MAETLNEVERRVIGVLLEKSLAQPQYYPMTANAIVAACNQKSNRDPIMNLDEEAVWNTLEVLRTAGLVSRLMPGGASRVERFKHEIREQLGWEKPQRAVMAELLLRGPQTVGELRTRCQRMYAFENTAAVQAVLDNLAGEDPPRVAPLPRAPGQSAIRYAHTLYPAGESPHQAAPAPEVAAAPANAPASASAPAPPTGAPPAPALEDPGLRTEVENLQSELADVHEALAELRRRVETLEQRGL